MAVGFFSNEVALYHTSKSMSKNVVMETLGYDHNGVTIQDFYPSYDKAPGLKQKCWSHLVRKRGIMCMLHSWIGL